MTVDIDRKTLEKIADLARIRCSEDDLEKFQKDLEEIVEYAELLDEVDTEGVEPARHVLADRCNVFRADEIAPCLDRDEFLKNAPEHIGGMVRVPPVIKK